MSRGVRKPLDRERIVAAALTVADREGLDGMTMRGVAEHLGVPVMNLYHYVSNKDDLLDAIADAALGQLELPDERLPWDEGLQAEFRSLRATILEHPSLGRLFAERPISGPNTFRAADTALGILLGEGFPPRAAVDAFTALLTYTIGSSLFAIARTDKTGTSDAERLRQDRLDAAAPEALPALSAAAEHMRVRGTEAEFEYGLDHLLDGLRSDLEARR